MSRLSYLGALFLAGTVAAQNAPTVQHVQVHGTGAAMEVEIQTSGAPVSPNTQVITGPDRIVVDFPGAVPSAELHALKVNQGKLKAVRSGLFFSNPPITRIVLDLVEPQSYQISTSQNKIVVKLGPAAADAPVAAAPTVGGARLQNASLATSMATPHLSTPNATPTVANAVIAANNPAPPAEPAEPPPPPKPTVTYQNGLLTIHSDKATLAQVLFEVHLKTQADIAIPAGAEQEQVVADLGPAPAREVLGTLLNGSSYNFIFVGNELALERVILTRRDNSIF